MVLDFKDKNNNVFKIEIFKYKLWFLNDFFLNLVSTLIVKKGSNLDANNPMLNHLREYLVSIDENKKFMPISLSL